MYRRLTGLNELHLDIQVVDFFRKANEPGITQFGKHQTLALNGGIDVRHLHNLFVRSIHPTIVPVGSGVPIFCNAEKRERQPPDLLTFKRLNLGELFSGDVHTVQTDEWKLAYVLCNFIKHIRPMNK